MIRRAFILLPLLLLLPPCAIARAADEVKIDTFWIPGVTVRGFADGSIIFTTDAGGAGGAGGERVVPLDQLHGIRSTVESKLTDAEAALAAGDKQKAIELFRAAAGASRQGWVRQWAGWKQVVLLDESGAPGDAVRAYLALARLEPDPYFLAAPPLAALRRAKEDKLGALKDQIDQARRSADGIAATQLDAMSQLIASLRDGSKSASPSPAAMPPGASSGESAVVLPVAMEADDAITALLRAGRFDEAARRAEDRLQHPEPLMAMRLYQLGVAQLQLAIAQQQRDGELSESSRTMYLDAGLSLMYVPIYFPRSPYKGPALMEAGLVHQKIGREDVAMSLWAKAQVEIDPQTDPQLSERLNRLMGIDIETIEEQGILKSN
jgi:hypothetical protein